jgi:hypothetical protein
VATMDLSHATWRKSSLSTQNGSCVEVTTLPGHNVGHGHVIAVRDSKDPHGPALVLPPGDWQRFTGWVKARRDNHA